MTGTLTIIDLERITPSETNPRKNYDQGRMEDLVQSIKDRGVLQPVIVRPYGGRADQYELVCGWRRVLASRQAGLTTIPAIVEALSDKDVLEIQVIENLQREEVHPLEEANGYARLIRDYGYGGVDEVAARIGKSASYVYQRLKLCDLTENTRALYADGKMSLAAALAVAKIPAEKQDDVAEHVSGISSSWDRPMTERQIREYIVDSVMLSIENAPFDANAMDLVEDRGTCFECPKMSGFNIDLFPEMCEENLCSDESCYRAKQRAWYLRSVEPFRTEGYSIVEPENYDSVFDTWRFFQSTEECRSHPERLTYGEILSKSKTTTDGAADPSSQLTRPFDMFPKDQVFVGVDKDGQLAFAVRREDVEKLTREADPDGEIKDEEDVEDSWDGFRREAVRAAEIRIIPEIGKDVKKTAKKTGSLPFPAGFLRAFLKESVDADCLVGLDYFKEAHPEIILPAPESGGGDESEQWCGLIDELEDHELCALFVELFLFSSSCFSSDENYQKAFAAYGVHIEAEIDHEIERLMQEGHSDGE